MECHNGFFYPYQPPGSSEDHFLFHNTRLFLNFRKQDKKMKWEVAVFSFEPMNECWQNSPLLLVFPAARNFFCTWWIFWSSAFKRIIPFPNPWASPDNLFCVWFSFRICECTEAEAEIILQLKSELREKELKLTDIRLEALSSAHHLDQIREAMNRMQVCASVLQGTK